MFKRPETREQDMRRQVQDRGPQQPGIKVHKGTATGKTMPPVKQATKGQP